MGLLSKPEGGGVFVWPKRSSHISSLLFFCFVGRLWSFRGREAGAGSWVGRRGSSLVASLRVKSQSQWKSDGSLVTQKSAVRRESTFGSFAKLVVHCQELSKTRRREYPTTLERKVPRGLSRGPQHVTLYDSLIDKA